MFRTVTIAALLALGVLSAQAGPSAWAGSADRPLSVVVHFGDLDLNQPADARVLVQRLRQAARTVCTLGDIIHNSYCVDQVTRDAFNQAVARKAAVASAGK